MEEGDVARILRGLASPEPGDAWTEFLTSYAPLVEQVVALFERNPDHVRDCFLFVSERLAKGRFRRLRAFRPEGSARFSTWLRVVMRRLCVDWHRREFGRHRIFRALDALSRLDREVFHGLYERGLTTPEVFTSLMPRFPGISPEQLAESEERLRRCLTSRQRWLLSVRRPRLESLEADPSGRATTEAEQLPDGQPNPEARLVLKEQRAALARAISGLPAQERLVIRLRFEEELTLEQMARLLKLKDAYAADRTVRAVLKRLRHTLG